LFKFCSDNFSLNKEEEDDEDNDDDDDDLKRYRLHIFIEVYNFQHFASYMKKISIDIENIFLFFN